MKKISIHTQVKKWLADIYTPVGIYLRLRDKYRDTILLDSTDNHAAENSYSFICVNAIAGIEISSAQRLESKLPGQKPEQLEISDSKKVPSLVWEFMQKFDSSGDEKEARFAQGLYGYTTYDAIRFF
jgi:anthranilate synthase component 1